MLLEQENLHLQAELQSTLNQEDENRSDLSDTITEQHKELVQTIQQKNKQISQLLSDVENVGKENVVIQENLLKLRTELSDATEQVSFMTNELKALTVRLNEKSELITTLEEDNNVLRTQVNDFIKEKKQRDNQIDEFTTAIDTKLNKWQKIIQEKDNEIKKLKTKSQQDSIQSSETNVSVNEDKSYTNILNKIITDRENQLSELRSQLQDATNEMEKSTELLNQLTIDKRNSLSQINELTKLVGSLKTQLRTAHERSRELQENIEYVESIAEGKQKDLNDILKKLKSEGKTELHDSLEEIQTLKTQLRIKSKQVSDYVKITNKLQNSTEYMDKENMTKCQRQGFINTDQDPQSNSLNMLTQSSGVDKIKKKVMFLENDNIKLRSEIQELHYQLSKYLENKSEQVVNSLGDITEPIVIESMKKNKVFKEQLQELVEENEALRKGLHEVLDSIQKKNDSSEREIKSETLRKLLYLLDTRHISGWYHPAMRLQAELHSMQGANVELRKQLKTARMELTLYQQPYERNTIDHSVDHSEDNRIPPPTDKIPYRKQNLDTKDNEVNRNLIEQLEKHKSNFEVLEAQLSMLYNQHKLEKEQWENKEKLDSTEKNQLKENVAILEAKLNEFSHHNDEDFKKTERLAILSSEIVVLNRKCVYFENEESRLSSNIKSLKSDLNMAEETTSKKFSELKNENIDLMHKLCFVESLSVNTVTRHVYEELQKTLDTVTIKYRHCLQEIKKFKDNYQGQLIVLNKTIQLLGDQKSELESKLLKTNTDFYLKKNISDSNGMENLSKKLAQIEINEITERQRANHMNNLYGLVKEQLQKSETHLQEIEKQNKELTHQSIVYQENIKNLEDKLMSCVENHIYEELTKKLKESIHEVKDLLSENNKLKSELNIVIKTFAAYKATTTEENLEILSLKHQILDLQASGDDKALIARLSSDVVLARLSETQYQKRLEDLDFELKDCQNNYSICKNILNQLQTEKNNLSLQYSWRISMLEYIVRNQRQLYLGSLPLVSEEIFTENIWQLVRDKQIAFELLQSSYIHEQDNIILKEQLNKQMQIVSDVKASYETNKVDIQEKIEEWHQERNLIVVKELQLRRQLDFKNMQSQQFIERIKHQDELIAQLEEQLLNCYYKNDVLLTAKETKSVPKVDEKFNDTLQSTVLSNETKILCSKESQTILEVPKHSLESKNIVYLNDNVNEKLDVTNNTLAEKNTIIEQLKVKITELEMNISLFRSQIGDKQSQITFYEKHILELQNKISSLYNESTTMEQNNIIAQSNNNEIAALKDAVKKLQETNLQKDTVVLKYQTLLKRDRDEHSLAAARVQQEMKQLQEIITQQEKAYNKLQKTSIHHPGKAAIEQYIHQVHALEKHTADLHTSVSTLNSQLQASREEAVRWQTLADERLDSMDQLRSDLEQHHQQEIAVYKKDSERWREEIMNLKEVMNKYRNESNQMEPDISKLLKEKEDEIRDLSLTLKRVKNEMKKNIDKSDSVASPKVIELESNNEQLVKDYETLKKRYEQVLLRERNAKDEIHSLKEQLLKKPVSTRNDKGDKEERLQKKIKTLEKELEELQGKYEKLSTINEAHRIAVTEDFEKWKKQKYWQQTSEKLKVKLQEKNEEFEKSNTTCAGYRVLIERLEREKHNLENRIKTLKSTNTGMESSRIEALCMENEQLRFEIDSLNAKHDLRHHYSGTRNNAVLQDKLETQERKIAVLEITSKSTSEIRLELERLHNTIENLQKINLRLEAENLDLKLDLEKYINDAPHLREQIQHLENYIEILKTENESKHVVSESGDYGTQKSEKKLMELERTIFVLKRVIEKLQVENKRLQGRIKLYASNTLSSSSDKMKGDSPYLSDHYNKSLERITYLEEQLKMANDKILDLEKQESTTELYSLKNELSFVKNELIHKSQLLDKIKVLLQRAAIKEKSLLEEIAALKAIVPRDGASTDNECTVD